MAFCKFDVWMSVWTSVLLRSYRSVVVEFEYLLSPACQDAAINRIRYCTEADTYIFLLFYGSSKATRTNTGTDIQGETRDWQLQVATASVRRYYVGTVSDHRIALEVTINNKRHGLILLAKIDELVQACNLHNYFEVLDKRYTDDSKGNGYRWRCPTVTYQEYYQQRREGGKWRPAGGLHGTSYCCSNFIWANAKHSYTRVTLSHKQVNIKTKQKKRTPRAVFSSMRNYKFFVSFSPEQQQY